MRFGLVGALIGSTFLTAGAFAQPAPEASSGNVPAAGPGECDRLIAFLDASRPVAGITLDQARQWQRNSDAERCRQALNRVTQASSDSAPQGATSPGYGTQPGISGAPGDSTRAAPAASAATAGEPQSTGALPGQVQLDVAKLEDMSVYNARNEKMGEVDDVVAGPDGKLHLVIEHGGFLGLGEREVMLSLDHVFMREDRLVTELSDDSIKALPAFKKSGQFRELEGRARASIRAAR